ncbi:MAG: hypothetical protein IPL84_04575 [Chitinophagaceae bacterium]|nr:hypothetical protein [Chitinophagaceae bacterium]
MKKIFSLLIVFVVSASTIFAQPANRKQKAKQPNNFSWGLSTPGTNAKTGETTKEGTNLPANTKPKANRPKQGTSGKRKNKP